MKDFVESIEVYAVIVLYRPDNILLKNLLRTKEKLTSKIIVVLNESENRIDVINFFEKERINYIENKSNVGLAAALNQGIKFILETSASKYILLLDQDSSIVNGFTEKLLSIYFSLADQKIACVAPSFIKDDIVKIKKCEKYEYVNTVITSGQLIHVSALKHIGLMDESLFIDGIDHEWCFRATYLGYKIVKANNVFLIHSVGDKNIKIPFLKISKNMHSNPARYYYIIRNSLILTKRKYIPLKWRIIELFKTIRRIGTYFLFSKEKKKAAYFLYKGVIDGTTRR